ncbi:NAD(P)H-dependent glycerol-3-phosphate dehydrogenase [Thermodesulfatator autotrophicus]|uniref:Glycerol-3-phosphate dehydrogenase [NAD(P)+] n=1 Tax=Thermodesulfatator autotrophicus TaxID=1795632 RepID=A0A177E8K7_9BACT|nr:NAD(P)H-dependent glycerol-3-phosphate dehydrogenase [Thermodesulfatator autotrophicus]OAG27552.1 glycerol-3-phosphate dehydrogenase [Thermodesulfatator autotrophicus]
MKVVIIGAGSWGTALGKLLAEKGKDVYLLARRKEVCESINKRHENPFYLPRIKLPNNLKATVEPNVLRKSELIVLAVPSHALRKTLKSLRDYLPEKPVPLVSTIKGIEEETLATMSQVIKDVLFPEWHSFYTVLSGPSFAEEVARRLPTAVTIAGYEEEITSFVQKTFASQYFRTYRSLDVMGVELAGALKNVIAIAVGISDGLELGLNARAALITRGLAEISRLGVKLGANPLTFSGLAGMGDLVLTCTGSLSRNRTVGLRLGRGEKLKDILAGLTQVAEGVRTTASVRKLAQKVNVETPICEAVYQVLYKKENPYDMVSTLLSRKLKQEFDF